MVSTIKSRNDTLDASASQSFSGQETAAKWCCRIPLARSGFTGLSHWSRMIDNGSVKN
ncbi:MAG TPA: hypothetical protein VLR44_06165 [Rhodoferax sp.]|nr:hypothetical protein [Rhodoferax sp.]HSN79946.1 hypothetical protein [Rhodoferax sp.]